jgi:hypothetical protein
MTSLNLPEPIAAYFDADRRDGAAVARCFTKQTVVKDKGRTPLRSCAHQGVEDCRVRQVFVHQRPLRRGAGGRPAPRRRLFRLAACSFDYGR